MIQMNSHALQGSPNPWFLKFVTVGGCTRQKKIEGKNNFKYEVMLEMDGDVISPR